MTAQIERKFLNGPFLGEKIKNPYLTPKISEYLFSHRPQIMLFMLPKFTNDLFRGFTPKFILFIPVKRQLVLFLHDSSLQKQPLITAHFRSSLHILCITAR